MTTERKVLNPRIVIAVRTLVTPPPNRLYAMELAMATTRVATAEGRRAHSSSFIDIDGTPVRLGRVGHRKSIKPRLRHVRAEASRKATEGAKDELIPDFPVRAEASRKVTEGPKDELTPDFLPKNPESGN